MGGAAHFRTEASSHRLAGTGTSVEGDGAQDREPKDRGGTGRRPLRLQGFLGAIITSALIRSNRGLRFSE